MPTATLSSVLLQAVPATGLAQAQAHLSGHKRAEVAEHLAMGASDVPGYEENWPSGRGFPTSA